MTELLPEERETHFNMTGDNHGLWEVFTDDPYWIRKLDKVATGEIVGAGKAYKLRADQLLVRAGKARRTYTDEQKAVLAERMRVARKTIDASLEITHEVGILAKGSGK